MAERALTQNAQHCCLHMLLMNLQVLKQEDPWSQRRDMLQPAQSM